MNNARSHKFQVIDPVNLSEVLNKVFGKAHLRDSGSDFEGIINFKEREHRGTSSSNRNVVLVMLKEEEHITKSLVNRPCDVQELLFFLPSSDCPVLRQILSSFRLASQRVTTTWHLQGMHSVLANLHNITSFPSYPNKTVFWEIQAASP